MNYITKQRNARLESWYICHKLGIKLNDWVKIRRGRKALVSHKLDMFNELAYTEANEYINQKDEKKKIDEWYKLQTSRTLKEMLDNFKVVMSDVANTIGCNTSTISHIIKDWSKSSDVKYLLYYYFQDENNKNYEVKKRKMPSNNKIKKHLIQRQEEENHNSMIAKELNVIIENQKKEIEKLNQAIKDDKENADEIIMEQQNEIEKLNKLVEENKEEIWYQEYQKMATLYQDTKQELDRYRYLIDLSRLR